MGQSTASSVLPSSVGPDTSKAEDIVPDSDTAVQSGVFVYDDEALEQPERGYRVVMPKLYGSATKNALFL